MVSNKRTGTSDAGSSEELFDLIYYGSAGSLREFLSSNRGVRSQINAKDAQKDTVLGIAAKKGDVEVIDILMEYGALPTVTIRVSKNTPMHVAAAAGHHEALGRMIQSLEAKQVDCVNLGGDTPLMFACAGGHLKAAHLLINHGASGAVRNQSGMTALMTACALKTESPEDADTLVGLLAAATTTTCKQGGGGAAHDLHGNTPLHYACQSGRSGAVAALLAAAPPAFTAALLAASNKQGRTPLQEAEACGAGECARLVREELTRQQAKADDFLNQLIQDDKKASAKAKSKKKKAKKKQMKLSAMKEDRVKSSDSSEGEEEKEKEEEETAAESLEDLTLTQFREDNEEGSDTIWEEVKGKKKPKEKETQSTTTTSTTASSKDESVVASTVKAPNQAGPSGKTEPKKSNVFNAASSAAPSSTSTRHQKLSGLTDQKFSKNEPKVTKAPRPMSERTAGAGAGGVVCEESSSSRSFPPPLPSFDSTTSHHSLLPPHCREVLQDPGYGGGGNHPPMSTLLSQPPPPPPGLDSSFPPPPPPGLDPLFPPPPPRAAPLPSAAPTTPGPSWSSWSTPESSLQSSELSRHLTSHQLGNPAASYAGEPSLLAPPCRRPPGIPLPPGTLTSHSGVPTTTTAAVSDLCEDDTMWKEVEAWWSEARPEAAALALRAEHVLGRLSGELLSDSQLDALESFHREQLQRVTQLRIEIQLHRETEELIERVRRNKEIAEMTVQR